MKRNIETSCGGQENRKTAESIIPRCHVTQEKKLTCQRFDGKKMVKVKGKQHRVKGKER